MSSQEEIVPVVDLNDEIIGYKARKDITPKDIYRVSGCWVTDPAGSILLQQRSFTKKSDPGKWTPAVAGTVEKGETYISNILKEIKEEIGIMVHENELSMGEKFLRQKPKATYFVQRFILVYTGKKSYIQAEEGTIEQLKWFTPDELKEVLITSPDEYMWSVGWGLENF